MSYSTISQLIRIVAYTAGGFLVGQEVADGDMFQAALNGLVAIGAFAWWLIVERMKESA
jgi:membrane protein DedA with SNARE-associated domain